MENIKLNGYNNLELNCYLYKPSGNAKAVIQIIHGMQEHAFRYDEFAKFLADNGFIVLASDLRGHGKTAPSLDKLGFGEKDIFEETLKDQTLICEYLKKEYNLPIYIFGHSYGSFLSQRFIQICEIPEKIILCGTGFGDNAIYTLGYWVACLLSSFDLDDKKATIIENMSLKAYGKKFNKGNWLTRDDSVFESYSKDEYSGKSFPISFYKSFFRGITHLNDDLSTITNNKKIFLIVGDKDPVGSNGKQVQKLYELYKKENKNATIKIYPNCRHELINELNKDEVYKDILDFYNS